MSNRYIKYFKPNFFIKGNMWIRKKKVLKVQRQCDKVLDNIK